MSAVRLTVGMALVQSSLLDLGPEEGPGPLSPIVERTDLGSGAWIDVARQWVTGANALFDRLLDTVPWQAERRVMYDRVVDVPRLLRFYSAGERLPDPVLEDCLRVLNEWYHLEASAPFVTLGLAYYRDGRDGVAWHGDRIGRGSKEDTVVAILSLGATRRLLLRPRGGGSSLRWELGSGDLLVMGGSCQRTWDHTVPKTSRAIGPRISVQFRPAGVA
jgi:alkylated DNA repair dioxygenase AlkB